MGGTSHKIKLPSSMEAEVVDIIITIQRASKSCGHIKECHAGNRQLILYKISN